MSNHADFETRSPVDLTRHGAHVYFEHPDARVLIGSFRIGETRFRWRDGEPCPPAAAAAIEAGEPIYAHNAEFEWRCFNWLANRRGWPRPKLEQMRCTAAMAAAMQLPRDLDRLGDALGLETRKDKEGKRLMRLFSIPDRDGRFVEPEDAPEEFEAYRRYCDIDVEVESEAETRMIPLSDTEQAVYTLTARINDRGIRVDVESARAAMRLAEKAARELDAEMREATQGAVKKTSQVAALKRWLGDYGIFPDSLDAPALEDLLSKDDLPSHVRRVLELRQEGAKSSVAKLQGMIDRAGRDGRVRGSAIYHAAGTGRTQSAGVNFNNLPRPRKVYEDAGLRTDVLFDAFRREDPGYLRILYGPELGRPLHLVADAIRGFLWADPGHDLIQADFSNVEGVVVAWLAGEQWKLDAFAAIFADPSIPDMYRQTAAKILGLPLDEVTKKHWSRQAVGKPAELGLGFQGGVNAFLTFATAGRVDLAAIAPAVLAQADPETVASARGRFRNAYARNAQRARDLPEDAWVACEVIKRGWREQNPAIAQMWADCEAAARNAVANPGQVFEAGRVQYLTAYGCLWARLPSGRALCYGAPKLRAQVWAEVLLEDGSWSMAEVMPRDQAERGEQEGWTRIKGETSAAVTAMTVDSKTKQVRRIALYGGLLVENNTQGTARDLLVNGMFNVEAAGYPIILTVYDEIVAEVRRGFGSLDEFQALMCRKPGWAGDMPIAAGGWRGKRYRKD